MLVRDLLARQSRQARTKALEDGRAAIPGAIIALTAVDRELQSIEPTSALARQVHERLRDAHHMHVVAATATISVGEDGPLPKEALKVCKALEELIQVAHTLGSTDGVRNYCVRRCWGDSDEPRKRPVYGAAAAAADTDRLACDVTDAANALVKACQWLIWI